LLNNLQHDDHPILLEGIHCSYYLHTGKLAGRKIIVRLHNAEFEYYRQLAALESNLFKKMYYRHESGLLKQYEHALSKEATLLAVSEQDVDMYQRHFNAANIHYLPVFLPYDRATGSAGKGSFCLYHGNLAINENEEAAIWLLKNVFDKLELPFVVAGRSPSKRLEHLCHVHKHTCLVADPSDSEMQDMIWKAHIHVIPAFNNTGIKLKLLNAVFNGRHCVVNQAAVEGSGLDAFVHLATGSDSFVKKIGELYNLPFNKGEAAKRQQLLDTVYNNDANAEKLIAFLW
jgi:Glycosyl transferases group 1